MPSSRAPIDHTHTMTTGAEPSWSGARLVVRVVEGPDRGVSVALEDTTLVVGASTSVDLALHDAGVSRRHLEISVVEGGVRVVDLGSKNGTLLQGARLSAAVVGVGAELVLGKTRLRIDAADLVDELPEVDALGGLATQSTAMRRCLGVLARVARAEIPVLLVGEDGVDVREVARALHAASARAARALHEVKVSAIAQGLIGATLFGGEQTGGAFERAHGGTLLLEDIDAVPAGLQGPLARAIETGMFARSGDPEPRRASVRVVAATTEDLDALVRADRMRAELRDALSAVRVVVPPLRERQADLPALCRALLDELGADAHVHRLLDDAAWARLRAHRFVGNARELRQILARAIASGSLVGAIDEPAPSGTLRDEKERFERDKLAELLRAHGGNVSAAARAAGFDRRHLHRLMKKHGLRGG